MELAGGCILCIIFVAGLWPFHAPKNQVKWLESENGLHLGRYSSLISVGAFQSSANDVESGSVEIWLQPDRIRGAHAILSFAGSNSTGTPFALFQSKDNLRIERRNPGNGGRLTTWFEVTRVFREKSPVFVTVILEKQQTLVYLNGVFVKSVSADGIAIDGLGGRLLLGNSPGANDTWSGLIRGLAIYRGGLNPGQVAQHYESWTRSLRPSLTPDESPLALYMFNEGRGTIVHNEIDQATSLTIPERYFVLNQEFLTSPLREYNQTWGYWEDVAINIAGFIPLGVWAGAYFLAVRPVKAPAVVATLLGFLTSFTIEVLQAFLPTRNSGMTDLITNTLGTVIGVALYRWSVVRRVLRKDDNHISDQQSELDTVLSA